ncbi:MAG: HAD family hydrolase [Bacillota bacterium]|nr:HAD family hydrolase [Bacillota bacterium]NLP22540.1 Cof-type HAD-IIB family hydrolase [Erysipelotrichaceae bacterium]
MSKIIFIDVDGTLITYENKLPESAKKAVIQARKNNHLVYLCTGRSKAEMPDYILDIGLDGIICGNGSYVEHNGKVIMHKLISKEDAKEIVDWLHSKNLEFYLESNNGLFASRNFREVGKKPIQQYSANKGETNYQNLEVEDVLHGLIFDGKLYRDDLNKVSFVLNSYQDYLDAKEKFSHLPVGTWGGKGEKALFGDIGIANVTKENAIDYLLKYLKRDVKDTFAFGDAIIDISMLEFCNIGVAMNSGQQEIKEIADYVTDDVDKDGLYNAFKHFNLI